MAGDPRPGLSPHMGTVSRAEAQPWGHRGSSQAGCSSLNFLPGEKIHGKKSIHQLCFMENIIQVAVSAKAQNKACSITRLSVKVPVRRSNLTEFWGATSFRSSPPQSHVWSLNSSPRQQAPASKSLLPSETFPIVQQPHRLFKQAPLPLKID